MSKDSERIYHIERKVDEILEILKHLPTKQYIYPGVPVETYPWWVDKMPEVTCDTIDCSANPLSTITPPRPIPVMERPC